MLTGDFNFHLVTAEFYVNSPNIEPLISEVQSIAAADSDFNHNALAMRKRMYYIMVELACIHEQFRSSLIRRQQLTEEGLYMRERLQELPEILGSGLDTMVP